MMSGQETWSPRIMHPTADADFEVEVKFQSALTSEYQIQGVIVEQTATISYALTS